MTILGRGDWTEEYHALIDGKAQVDVYVTWRKDIYFQYPGQDPQTAITKRYRVANPQVFLDALVKHKPGDFGLSPGELLDESGRRFMVMESVLDLFDGEPKPRPATFILDDFEVEGLRYKDAVPSVDEVHSELGMFISLFRAEHPKGGLVVFRSWAAKRDDCRLVKLNEGDKLPHWVEWDSPGCFSPIRWAISTISNKLSGHPRRR